MERGQLRLAHVSGANDIRTPRRRRDGGVESIRLPIPLTGNHELYLLAEFGPYSFESLKESEHILSRVQPTDGEDVTVTNPQPFSDRSHCDLIRHRPEALVWRVVNDRDAIGRDVVGGLNVTLRVFRSGDHGCGAAGVGTHLPA